MGKLLNWFRVQLLRDEMLYHCDHQQIGACSEECAGRVMADRW